MLGEFVEFELEEGVQFEDLDYYLIQNNIQGNPSPLYGDIFKSNMTSPDFKKRFERRLSEVLTLPRRENETKKIDDSGK